jgi:hypothetical protein
MSKHVCVYLDDDQAPQVKITARKDSVVLNEIQWFILVTFNEYKCGIHELGDPSHNLFMYCRRYIRIKCGSDQVVLLLTEWSYLMKLASACLDRQIRKLSVLQEEVSAWHDRCLESNTYRKPPSTSVIDFECLYDELMFYAQR